MTDIKELTENKEFLAGLVEAESPERLAKLFEENGVVLEDGISIEDAFKMIKEQEHAELDEAELEDVSGGIGLLVGLSAAGSLIVSAGMLSFLGGYAYQAIKKRFKK